MKKILIALILVLLTISGLFLVRYLQSLNVSPLDSDALIGGQPENGYPAAGFFIGYSGGEAKTLCGTVLIGSKLGVTAAHCLEGSDSFGAGLGQFSVSSLASVAEYQTESGWDNKSSTHDFSIIVLNQEFQLSEYAKITTPVTGCNYRIVAYGRTENDGESLSLVRERKGGDICIKEIDRYTFLIESPNSGICLGDSGSPIFEKGTNNLVGIISAIYRVGTNPCYIENTAIVKRVDTALNVIAQYKEPESAYTPTTVAETEPIASTSEIIPANSNSGESIPQSQVYLSTTVIIFVIASVFIFLLIAVSVLQKPKQQQPFS